MAKLTYTMLASLDGYVADERGEFGWAEPDEEVHRFANDLERPVGTYLYGRRMYQVMAVWDDPAMFAAGPDYIREFGELWRAAERRFASGVVYLRYDVREGLDRPPHGE